MKPLIQPSRPFLAKKPDLLLAFVLVCVCVLVSALAISRLHESNRQSLQRLFDGNFERIADGVHERVSLYEYGLLGARGSYVSNAVLPYTLSTYRRYAASRNIDKEFPGARGFGLIFNVAAEDVSRFEQDMSEEYGEQKLVKNLNDPRGTYFVIRYIEPYARNVQAVGLNIASEPSRLKAAIESVKTGKATITAPITVVQATDQVSAAFLLLLPIQRHHLRSDTPAPQFGDLGQTLGWSYAVLVFGEIVKNLDFEASQLAVRISDVTDPAAPVFFSSGQWQTEGAEFAGSKRLAVFGRTWQMDAQLLPGATAHAPYDLSLAILMAALFSGLVVALSLYIWRAKRRAFNERLYELALAQGIIEGSPIGQLLVDAQGKIAKINRRVTELFGYQVDELIGQAIERLVPARHAVKHMGYRKSYDGQKRQMAQGRLVTGLHRAGHEFPVEVSLTRLEVGQQGYVLVSVLDVSERTRFLNQLQQSESKWRELANCLPQLTWTMNEEMRIDFLNERWGSLPKESGIRHMEEHFYSAIVPEDLTMVRSAVAKASV
ncbi:MAG TPA: CHASE domain-containing protein, partial [Limnobacter sp.]|nr:CHASE domain-containing protein [Limnobacter sp.]